MQNLLVNNEIPIESHEMKTPVESDKGGLVIVGAGWPGYTIAKVILKQKKGKISCFVDDKHEVGATVILSNGNDRHIRHVAGPCRNLLSIVKAYSASGVVIAVAKDNLSDDLLAELVQLYLAGIPVFEMPDLFARLTKKVPVHHLDHQWFLPQLSPPPNNFSSVISTAVDYLFSCLCFLTVLLPLYPLIALIIKLDSRGPVLYQQQRVGKCGQVFTLFKFRTMHKNADREGTAWTLKGDDRITRVGKVLRKLRLDEVPQILNIMKGDMSLIGPRPEAVALVEEFKKQIPFYEYRYLVRPGITGWAQVNYENTCSVEGALEKLQYDLYWLKHRSFLLNLKILFKSFKVILTGYGAV